MAEKIHRSRISNTEWGMVIGALFVVDAIQLILDLVGVGLVINYGIEIMIGSALPFYLQIRGEKMSDPKRLFGFLATFGLELFIPLVDGLPFWTLDGIYNFILAKRRDKEAAKQEGELVVMEKQMKIEKQAEQQQKILLAREKFGAQNEQREEQRVAVQNENERNALEDSNEDLYDQAA